MTSTPTIEIRPMTTTIGAEISGVDLAEDLEPRTVAEIRAALLRWKVVFFRDQPISRAQHVALGRHFGDVTPAHPTLPAAFPEHPEILLLDNQRTFEKAGTQPNVDNRWHTDVSFSVNPPMGSILRSNVVPPYGGDTQWSNLAVAYETLSHPMRNLLDGLWAVHHNHPPAKSLDEEQGFARTFQTEPLRTRHPVVRVHPETGERVLFVNPLWTSHIADIPLRESDAILTFLYEHLKTPMMTVRFRWEPDSIAFWDNRSTTHIAPIDVPTDVHRSMERITLAGDVPVGVDGEPSKPLSGDLFT